MDYIYAKKADCCGCEVCKNVCPMSIINIEADEEGFYYPKLTSPDKCINCNRCMKVCPQKNIEQINSSFKKSVCGWAKDEKTVLTSSSGGFAAILSSKFVECGGVVYGVGYSDDYYSVKYYRAMDEISLQKFQSSKYSQAIKGDIYKEIEQDLKANIDVLFIGTPCDCYAIKRYLGNYPGLRTVAIICHGPTSGKVQRQFCEELEKKYNAKIVDFSLRYKKDGNWKPYYIKADFSNGKSFIKRFDHSDYDIAFQYFKRPSCGECHFKNNHFAADLLIGDYHSAEIGSDQYNRRGVSSIITLSENGNDLLNLVSSDFEMMEVSMESSISQRAVHSPVKKTINREEYVSNLSLFGLASACSIETIVKQKRKSDLKKRIIQTKVLIKRTIRKILR